MSTTFRRPKWHLAPPPPPSPKILHFPLSRRTRRKHHRSKTTLLLPNQPYYFSHFGDAHNLFDRETNTFPKNIKPQTAFFNAHSKNERRERVEEEREECFGEYDGGGGGGAKGFVEEKWRFQAEILRAECNFLRMERELALKKLERNRVKMERTLRSAVQTLVSGRKKIFEGKSVNAALQKEIEDLSEKLQELHRTSRVKDSEIRNCTNFDKKACLLQRRLEKLRELSDGSSSVNTSHGVDKCISNSEIENKSIEMEVILDKVEEENSSAASSASISKRNESPNSLGFPTRQLYQEEPVLLHEDNQCSGHCKAIIHRILEQVRAETEQWSQMQEMLDKVRGEMEELQSSRDFWENRAQNSDYETQSLKHAVEEWKEKALGHELKTDELQQELSLLRDELQKSKAELNNNVQEKKCTSENELNINDCKEKGRVQTQDLPSISLGKQIAKEKRMLIHRLNEIRSENYERGRKQELPSEGKRKPLRDIGNSTFLALERFRE